MPNVFSSQKSCSFLNHVSLRLNPNTPNDSTQGSKIEANQSIMDENISSFSTNFKTSGSDVKNTTTCQPYVLFNLSGSTPRTSTSLNVVGKNAEPRQIGEICIIRTVAIGLGTERSHQNHVHRNIENSRMKTTAGKSRIISANGNVTSLSCSQKEHDDSVMSHLFL